MSIKVLLADDSNVVRTAIVHILAQDPVGEAATFAETLRLTTALKPDILVLDLHMPDEPEYSPQIVKSQVLHSIDCILAISIWNDEQAKALADRLGAKTLLDKTKLYSELIPAIKFYCFGNGSEKATQDLGL
jgi:DNA-binding NarL/FixJ family response regulator